MRWMPCSLAQFCDRAQDAYLIILIRDDVISRTLRYPRYGQCNQKEGARGQGQQQLVATACIECGASMQHISSHSKTHHRLNWCKYTRSVRSQHGTWNSEPRYCSLKHGTNTPEHHQQQQRICASGTGQELAKQRVRHVQTTHSNSDKPSEDQQPA